MAVRRRKQKIRKPHFPLLPLLLVLVFLWIGLRGDWLRPLDTFLKEQTGQEVATWEDFCIWDEEDIPSYEGEPSVPLNGNQPTFSRKELAKEPYEYYSPLDWLGRTGYAEGMLDPSLMPTQPRESIETVHPSGWHSVRYDFIEEEFLFHRCHVLGFQLTGENANERNLMTGTQYFNIEGMLPWEKEVAGYLRKTGGRVMYRVTPIYVGKDLVARGVQMQARSVGSKDVCFHVFVFNVQPGVTIDYADGESEKAV